MILRARPARAEEFVAYQRELAFNYGNDPWVLERLPEFWRRIIGMPSVLAWVIEDTEDPQAPRQLLYVLIAFISSSLRDLILESEKPFASAELVRSCLLRGEDPLSLKGMREAQESGGMTQMTVHSRSPLVAPGRYIPSPVVDFSTHWHSQAIRGYRFSHCIREAFHPQTLEGYLTGGWEDWSDYGSGEPPSLERPHLLALSRDAAREKHGTRMAELFVDYPVRLDLRRHQVELLEAALEGLMDAEIADRFSLSVSAVKKRWISIYEQVERRAPNLLPFDGGRPDNRRGAEKRRHLLSFLREHPEELRSLEG